MRLITLFLLFFTGVCYAGFGLEGTRVIYNEGERNSSLVAFSTDSKNDNNNYLIQSWITNIEEKPSSDFVMTPPLFKLDSGDKSAINITQMISLPTDKETLYWINVKFIAPEKKQQQKDGGNSLNYSVTNKIKLIYRPKALSKSPIEDQFDKVVVTNNNNNIKISNPTNYFINMGSILFNGKEQKNPGLIAPNSNQIIKLDGSSRNISILFINDLGREIKKDYNI